MALPAYTRNMHQYALYWAPAVNDGFGGFIYSAPLRIRCRWQDRNTLIRNAQGREVASSAVVYVDRAGLVPQGRLFRDIEETWVLVTGYWDNDGVWMTDIPWDSVLPPPSEAEEILSIGTSPSLRGTQQLNKVWL